MPDMDPVGYDWLWKRSNPSAKRIQPIWQVVKDSKDLRQKSLLSLLLLLSLQQLLFLQFLLLHVQLQLLHSTAGSYVVVLANCLQALRLPQTRPSTFEALLLSRL